MTIFQEKPLPANKRAVYYFRLGKLEDFQHQLERETVDWQERWTQFVENDYPKWPRKRLAVGVVVVGLGWLTITWGGDGVMVPLHYGGLLAAVAGLTWLMVQCLPQWCFFWSSFGVGLAFLLLGWRASSDTYQVRWDNERAQYIDSVYRFRGGVKYRVVRVPGQFGYRSEGPMSAGHSPHGRWTIDEDTDGDGILDRSLYEWHWYGDKVSEGEFLKRQREVR